MLKLEVSRVSVGPHLEEAHNGCLRVVKPVPEGADGGTDSGRPRRNMLFLFPKFPMLHSCKFSVVCSDYAQLCQIMPSNYAESNAGTFRLALDGGSNSGGGGAKKLLTSAERTAAAVAAAQAAEAVKAGRCKTLNPKPYTLKV